MTSIGAIILISLVLKVSSLEISTIEHQPRSQMDSRDYVSAFLRSDIQKLENVLENMPNCRELTKEDEMNQNSYRLRANINCKKTRKAFEGLLDIFKKLDINYETYMDFSFNDTDIANTIFNKKKYQIVTRPTEATEAPTETSTRTGPGVIKYVLCFVQSTKAFKMCAKANMYDALGDSSSEEGGDGALTGEVPDIVIRGRYQMKFKKVTRGPDLAKSGARTKNDTLLNCINSAYEVFSTCVKEQKKQSSEETVDLTFREDKK